MTYEETDEVSEHDLTERFSAVPGDKAAQTLCSCGWEGLWRSPEDDGERWYGKVAIDVIEHLRSVGDEA